MKTKPMQTKEVPLQTPRLPPEFSFPHLGAAGVRFFLSAIETESSIRKRTLKHKISSFRNCALCIKLLARKTNGMVDHVVE